MKRTFSIVGNNGDEKIKVDVVITEKNRLTRYEFEQFVEEKAASIIDAIRPKIGIVNIVVSGVGVHK